MGRMGRAGVGLAAVAAGLALAGAAAAEIAVSVNDGKQLRPGDDPPGRTPDTLAVLDLTAAGPKVLASLPAPTSMIGPPTSVAVTPDARLALVTAAQTLDANGPATLVLDDTLTVVDLSNPAAPRVVQTLHAGAGATGVAVNRAGTLALVVSTGDDSVSVFGISGRRLTPAGKVRLPYQARPTDVAFTPDGKGALVVTQTAGSILRLAVDGTKVTRTEVAVQPGVQPYGIVVSPKGDFAYNTNLGGRRPTPGQPTPAGPRPGTISAIDLTTNQVATIVEVGQTPEHLTLSADGGVLAVVVANGSGGAPGSPGYNDFGLLKVYRVAGGELTPVAEAKTGRWCQGAAWTKDRSRVLLQCAGGREIESYRFDGTTLTRQPAETLKFAARPASIATATSR
ncbi:YncE family protein [Phenylobacterium sp.]|uniref:YncE family protein n=1 Tax=Phenylobacterium sp. TaxID=1871053 RepID=UPI002BDF5795|nr:YncE family protein [Phenylobacterium sp.]HVI33583.1 YncE family protein [Phenylobacterium sp.]